MKNSPEALDKEFVAALSRLKESLSAATTARRLPSPRESRFCYITLADCAERMTEAVFHQRTGGDIRNGGSLVNGDAD